jgi:hypothetical protein
MAGDQINEVGSTLAPFLVAYIMSYGVQFSEDIVILCSEFNDNRWLQERKHLGLTNV